MTTAITTIPFHGTSLYVIGGGTPETTLVAMRPVVEGMQLDWSAQHQKMDRHPVLKTCMVVTPTQMPGDDQVRGHTFMPLNRFHFWLATINPDRVKGQETRDKVIMFQTEAADVLFNHFFGRVFEAHDTIPDGSLEQIERSYGIVRMVNHKVTEIEKALPALVAQLVEPLVTARLAHQDLLIRHGKTAKQIWDAHHLPAKLRGSSNWFGNRLKEMGASIENEGRFDRGSTAIRLFDPDKAEMFLRNGLLREARVYASERMGQGRLRLVQKGDSE